MRRMVTSVMVCGLLVAGCGGESGGGDAAPSPTAPGPATSAPAAGGSGGTGGSGGSGGGGTGSLPPNERLAYMTKLVEINPALAENEGEAIRNGQATCRDIAKGATPQQLVENVRSRFGENLAPAQADQVLGVVRQYLCKS
ncbi:DUF732 domain-containing protein [Thermomonospora cellulosilytica]|uniref:DUF732 domain-containing protein n=1 Tax=Thermomonospora cellulosilytica TaxID=1411118 RepID=A0A7W3N206_9ACTN|nr:DUF732 domain-containing protein [Thermomonospora cellulosilytica]MBA9006096.1 hypothetical protein [Thermomonospora cellulosilytica]